MHTDSCFRSYARRFLIGGLAAALPFFIGCVVLTHAQSAVALPAAGRELLKIGVAYLPETLDPPYCYGTDPIVAVNLLYESLTRVDTQLQTVPGAAESWQYSPDATQLTFTLRSGLQYSDGTVLNAARFEYAILRNIDPVTAGDYGWFTEDIAGAEAWRNGSGTRADVDVHALTLAGEACTGYGQADCRLLRVGLRRPAAFFHSFLSMWLFAPVKEELIAAGGAEWWRDPQYQIGNGPFVLQAFVPGDHLRFIPNARYWRGTPTYDIEYRSAGDSNVAFTQYKLNQLDIIPATVGMLAEIQASPAFSRELTVKNGACSYAVMFHNQKPPFTDPKVRAAFAYAFDRAAWAHEVLTDTAIPTLSWIPPGQPGYDAQETRWGYSPANALQALAQSSYGSAAALPPITATFVDSPRNRYRFQWLIDHWQADLGVTVAFNPVPSDVYNQLIQNVETAPHLFYMGWCLDYPDPQDWLSTYWRTGAYSARFGYSNAAVDALLAQADGTIDPTLRVQLYQVAQRLVVGDAPAAFGVTSLDRYLVKNRVKGVSLTTLYTSWAGAIDPLTITVEPWQPVFLPVVYR